MCEDFDNLKFLINCGLCEQNDRIKLLPLCDGRYNIIISLKDDMTRPCPT